MFSVLGKRIMLFLFVTLGIGGLLLSWWIGVKEKELILDQLRLEAESVYQYAIAARHWLASNKGRLLKNGDKPSILSPCEFIHKLDDYSSKIYPYRVKIALLNPSNEALKADEFERAAISTMDERTPIWRIEKGSDGPVFRFVAPLQFSQECLNCHSDFPKDVQGCISVAIPATEALTKLSRERLALFFVVFLLIMIELAILLVGLKVMVLNPLGVMVDASQRACEGDLSVRIDREGEDEWSRLANNFNAMVEKILHHRSEMEQEVKKAIEKVERAYRELKETESFKAEFFSNITHDLKTPITAIKGAVDLLARQRGVEPTLDVIKKNIDKLSKMIGDLLDCARLESGKLEMNLEEQDLVEVVEETVFLNTLLAQQKNVTLNLESERETVVLPFDSDRISQVVANLLSNAIKFSPEGGVVNVKVGVTEGGWAVVSVEDSGPGIPKEKRDKVFEKFYRIDMQENSKGSTGLGLAICKGVVEAHGGRIEIVDPVDHKGTVVRFYLPGVREERV